MVVPAVKVKTPFYATFASKIIYSLVGLHQRLQNVNFELFVIKLLFFKMEYLCRPIWSKICNASNGQIGGKTKRRAVQSEPEPYNGCLKP
jgi:hypothetical protein